MENLLAELKPLTTKNRVRAGGLAACPQLRGWVLSLLGVGEVASGRQEYLMRRVFDQVVAEAYQKLEERGHRQRDRHDRACLVVAAAELLGLDNPSAFDLLIKRDHKARVNYENRKIRVGEGSRKARVAIWLGNGSASSGNNPTTQLDALTMLLTEVESRLRDSSFRDAVLEGERLTPSPSADGRWPGWYIRRPLLEGQVTRLIEDRTVNVVALVGGAGMGKSSLAAGTLQHLLGDEQVPVIRFVDGQPALRDLAPLLDRHGYDAGALDETTAPNLLSRLISGRDAPPLILLDNLSSTDELDTILPFQPVSTVVATARTQGYRERPTIATVTVGEMLLTEAEALARRLCPELSDEDCTVIAWTMGGHPLAVSFACGLISHSKVDVRALCDQVRARAGSIPTEHGEQLRVLTERMLAELNPEVEGRFALESVALAGIVATSNLAVPLKALNDAYLAHTDAGIRALCRIAAPGEEELAYATVIKNLKDLNIVRESRHAMAMAVFARSDDNEQAKAEARAKVLDEVKEQLNKLDHFTLLDIHPLAAEMLKEMLGDAYFLRLMSNLLQIADTAWKRHQSIPREDEERRRLSCRDLAFYCILLTACIRLAKDRHFPQVTPLPDSAHRKLDPLDEIIEVVERYSPGLTSLSARAGKRSRLLREGL